MSPARQRTWGITGACAKSDLFGERADGAVVVLLPLLAVARLLVHAGDLHVGARGREVVVQLRHLLVVPVAVDLLGREGAGRGQRNGRASGDEGAHGPVVTVDLEGDTDRDIEVREQKDNDIAKIHRISSERLRSTATAARKQGCGE